MPNELDIKKAMKCMEGQIILKVSQTLDIITIETTSGIIRIIGYDHFNIDTPSFKAWGHGE